MITNNNNIISVFGRDVAGYDPNTKIQVKIDGAHGEAQANQRFNEYVRNNGKSKIYGQFKSSQFDSDVRKYLCTEHKDKFGDCGNGKGRDNIELFAKDLGFLLETVARYFNAINGGLSPKHGRLESFKMRQEQNDCLTKTKQFFYDTNDSGGKFLWDCKMRFGKTHVAYRLIKDMGFKLVLVLTSRPTDTKSSWKNGLDHVDFVDMDFIDASEHKGVISINPNKPTIIFASLQDIARLNDDAELKEKFKEVSNLIIDLVIKDECHFGFDTDNTEAALYKLKYKHELNLSGTPFRALYEERFPDDAKFTWSYIDEQQARKHEIGTKGQVKAENNGHYYWLCQMKIFAILLSSELYEHAKYFTENEGFTFEKLFSVHLVNGKPSFIYDSAVVLFLRAISQGPIFPYSDQAHNTRQYKQINLNHALWYVPSVQAAKLLAEKLNSDKSFYKYRTIVAADDNNNEGNDTAELVKRRIADVESGRDREHIGTITLSCGKLSHGVSIPEWGSVFILSDMKTAQLYFQLIFRVQTPWKGKKHECYVFDFNPNRTLSMLYKLAQVQTPTSNPEQKLNEILNMFNVLLCEDNKFKQINASDLIAQLQSSLGRGTSISGLQNLLAELQFDFDDDLIDSADCIHDGSFSKSKHLDVNKNDIMNGKNYGGGGRSNAGGEKDLNKEKQKLEDQQREKIKIALSKITLLLFLTQDRSYDDLIKNLNNNDTLCKEITGLSSKSLIKILESQSKEKKQMINSAIVRFRVLEEEYHKS
jgi:superfamily II DNA or RNA helicase